MFGKLNKAAEQPRKSTMLPIKERLLAEAIGAEVEAAMLRALRAHDAEVRAGALNTTTIIGVGTFDDPDAIDKHTGRFGGI